MGRPKKIIPAEIEPEEISQEIPEDEPEAEEEEDEADAPSDAPNKSVAARKAIDAGYEKPGPAVAWIKSTFGIDINPQHFSAIKSNYKKKLEGTKPAKQAEAPAPKPRAVAPDPVQSAVPKAVPSNGSVIDDLTAIKALVAKLGVDEVKKIAELFG